MDADALAACLPTFALQTLVENALQHGAAARIEPTRVAIEARMRSGRLEVRVSDDGNGTDLAALSGGAGTGLSRLRERMRWLYGDAASLTLSSRPGSGFVATLDLPQLDRDEPT